MNNNEKNINDYLQNADFGSLKTELEGLNEKQALALVKEKMCKVESACSQMSFSLVRRDEEEEELENLIRSVDDLVGKAMESENVKLSFIRPIETITVAEYFLEGIKLFNAKGREAEGLLEDIRNSIDRRDSAIIAYTEAELSFFMGFRDLVRYIYGVCQYCEVQTHTFISKAMDIPVNEFKDSWDKQSVERIVWALEQIESKCTN